MSSFQFRSFTKSRGFTLVELLVVIAIIGTLVALLLPAIQAARESARRNQCVNNLKQIGLAAQGRHDVKKSFPAGRLGRPASVGGGGVNTFGVSWAFELLPYVEQMPLFQALKRSLPSTDAENSLAMRTAVSTFFCPSRREPAADRDFDNNDVPPPDENRAVAAGGDYAGSAGIDIDLGVNNLDGEPAGIVGGVFYTFSRISLKNVTDGTSQTIAVGEKYKLTEDEARQRPDFQEDMMHYYQSDTAFFAGDHRHTIMADTECGLAHGQAPAGATCGTLELRQQFGSEHGGVNNFVFLDGHVQAVADEVDPIMLQRVSTIADDQVVDTDTL
jgi:prepilin-type N-terminal cleavage/methylation domain-containing protein/prepilin-type processing-associated H-X9-DG protein